MSLKDRYDKTILKNSTNVVGSQYLSIFGNVYFDQRLKMIYSLIGSGLEQVTQKSTRLALPPIFEIDKNIIALGTMVSIRHYSKGEIQFATPRDDKEKLLVSILPPYSSYNPMALGKIYDYTGNIEAANERLVEWLAEVAPEHSAEIGAIIDRLETPPREQVIIMDRG